MAVRTVGAGKDHATVQDAIAWFVLNQADFTGLGPQSISVFDDEVLTSALDLTGLTTTSSDFLVIRGINNPKLTISHPLQLCFSSTSLRYNQLDGFTVEPSATFTGDRAIDLSYHATVKNCVVTNPNSKAISGMLASSSSSTSLAHNCLIYDFTTNAEYGISGAATTISECTVYNCDRGFRNNSSGVITDCIALDCIDYDFYGSIANSSYCASSDLSAVGTGSLTSRVATTEYVDPVNKDFTLKVGNTIDAAGSTGGEIGWVEFLHTSGAVVYDINGTNAVAAGAIGVAINAAGLLAVSTVKTVVLTDGTNNEALTVTNWNAGQPIVDVPLAIDLKWGNAALTLEVTDDNGTATLSPVLLQAASGWGSVELTSVPTPGTTESFAEITVADLGITAAAPDVLAFELDIALSVDGQWIPTVNPAQDLSGSYKVWDDSAHGYTATATYNIIENITNPPVVSTTGLSANENQNVAGTVQATNSPTSFAWGGGADDAKFDISASGVITLKAGQGPGAGDDFDYESVTTYNVSVNATNGIGTSANQAIVITIQDVPETPPMVTTTTLTPIEGQNIAGVLAGTLEPVSFAIKGTGIDDALFEINEGVYNQVDLITGVFDYATKSSYSINVTATNIAGESAEQTVTITVQENVALGTTPGSGISGSATLRGWGKGFHNNILVTPKLNEVLPQVYGEHTIEGVYTVEEAGVHTVCIALKGDYTGREEFFPLNVQWHDDQHLYNHLTIRQENGWTRMAAHWPSYTIWCFTGTVSDQYALVEQNEAIQYDEWLSSNNIRGGTAAQAWTASVSMTGSVDAGYLSGGLATELPNFEMVAKVDFTIQPVPPLYMKHIRR